MNVFPSSFNCFVAYKKNKKTDSNFAQSLRNMIQMIETCLGRTRQKRFKICSLVFSFKVHCVKGWKFLESSKNQTVIVQNQYQLDKVTDIKTAEGDTCFNRR